MNTASLDVAVPQFGLSVVGRGDGVDDVPPAAKAVTPADKAKSYRLAWHGRSGWWW
jgi:hypothetical protein